MQFNPIETVKGLLLYIYVLLINNILLKIFQISQFEKKTNTVPELHTYIMILRLVRQEYVIT